MNKQLFNSIVHTFTLIYTHLLRGCVCVCAWRSSLHCRLSLRHFKWNFICNGKGKRVKWIKNSLAFKWRDVTGCPPILFNKYNSASPFFSFSFSLRLSHFISLLLTTIAIKALHTNRIHSFAFPRTAAKTLTQTLSHSQTHPTRSLPLHTHNTELFSPPNCPHGENRV